MTEAAFKAQALRSAGIRCTLFPASHPLQRSILRVDEQIHIVGHCIGWSRWTDGGSIPWFGRIFANPLGYLFPAFLLHDILLFDGYGWEVANQELAKAMDALGAPLWQRIVVLEAVRANAKWQYVRARLGWEAMYVD